MSYTQVYKRMVENCNKGQTRKNNKEKGRKERKKKKMKKPLPVIIRRQNLKRQF